MNLQNLIRRQMLIAGVGLAILSAGAVRAQEITNTQFADGRYTEAFTQPVRANPRTVASTDSEAEKTLASTGAVDNPSGNARTERSYRSERVMWIVVALIWIGVALGIFFASLAKRFGPSLPSVAELKKRGLLTVPRQIAVHPQNE